LLALDDRGTVDLARTRAVYFPGNSGYFLINRASRPGGIVRPEEEEDVRRRLVAALEALRDPETKQPLVTQIIDPRENNPELGLGGPQGGDLYFDLARGYYPSSELRGELVSPEQPRGEHLLDPARPEMQAAFAIAGPGVVAGTAIGPIRQIDVAPTLCALLGIDPPAQATGRVLTEALVRRVEASGPGP
jgi:predicted AlkP superfamily phosphohydrolase/phosphomutase